MKNGTDSVVVSTATTAWHAGDLGSMPGLGRQGMFSVKICLSTLRMCIAHESENRVNVYESC